MNIIRAMLRITRFPYLITGIFIMFATRFLLIQPILGVNDFQLQFSNTNFILLVFALSSLIVAGYIINDYFDSKLDRQLNIKGVLIDNTLPRFTAISLHTVLNLLAVILSLIVSRSIGMLQLSVLFILASGLLWFYSTTYKHKKYLGKIVLSLMIACIPMVITLYEIPDLNSQYHNILAGTNTDFSYLFNWTGGFSAFLFIVSMIRLILKEKIETSDSEGKSILTITERGLLYLGNLSVALGFILLARYIFNQDNYSVWYYSVLIFLPVIISLKTISKTMSIKALRISDVCIKIISLAGILYTIVINYLFTNNLI